MGNQQNKQIVNQAGKQKKYVHWKSAEVPSAPGRPILIPVSEQQLDVITLNWDKPQSDGGSPILGYIIEHRRIGATSWIRSVPTLIIKNEATISGLEPGWKYQFRAIAENVVGHSQPSVLSDPLPVSLQMRNANTLPKFITELKDTNAIENERLEMRVRVFGNPQPEINWFKDGFEIFSSRRIKIVNENDFSMLIIHQIALTDEGEIKCTATNRAGHVATKANLIVEAPPKIRLPRNYEEGLIIEEDDVLKLKAGIAGQPFPAVIWSREGKVISDGSKFDLSTTDKHTLLKIGKVKRIDRGEYSIRAVNKLGEDTASFLVTVTAKPRSPGKVKLLKSHGTSVTLGWTEPEDDGGCKIGSYIVEYFRIGWDVWLKATTTRQLQTTLKDLIEGSEYKFRVKAENPYGVSEPSPESDILYLKSSSQNLPPTETSTSISDNVKLIAPPKISRKPMEQPNKQSKSPIRATSPSLRIIKPELFESEQLNMEMSYGAPVNIADGSNTNSSKSYKAKEDRGTSPKPVSILKQRSPIPTPRKNHANLILDVSSPSSAEQLQRSPSPKIEITPTKELPLSSDIVPSEPVISEPVIPERSLSPQLKVEENVETHKTDNTSPMEIRRSISPNLPSGNKQKSVSPSKILSETAQKIEERLKMEREKDEMKSHKPKSLQPEHGLKQNGDVNNKIQSEVVLKKSFEYLFNKMNENEGTNKIMDESRNKDEKKSEEMSSVQQEVNQNDSTDQQLSSDAEGKHKDEVHTSNEYMLVFYPGSKSKDIEDSESRNYYAGDTQGPPTLSYSFPNLSTLDEFAFQASIRRSASSTELLYEKAMARFYEAVEMEEEKKYKKKASHLGEHLMTQKAALQNLDSIAESQEVLESIQSRQRLDVEYDNALNTEHIDDNYIVPESLEDYKNATENKTVVMNTTSTGFVSPVNRRNLMEMTENQHVVNSFNNEDVQEFREDKGNMKYEVKEERYADTYRRFSGNEVKDNTFKNSLFDEERDIELEYGSDYTESTASESESSMEYFKREVITRSISGNINRKKVTLSPVRYSSEDDTLPATRQIKPMSSSDSIPKSILKKPSSSEEAVNLNINLSQFNPNPNPDFSNNPNPKTTTNSNQKIISNPNFELNQVPKETSNPNLRNSPQREISNSNFNMNSPQTEILNSNLNMNSATRELSNPKLNIYPDSNVKPNPHSHFDAKSNQNPTSNSKSNPNLISNPKSNPKSNPNPKVNPSSMSNQNPNPTTNSNLSPHQNLSVNPSDDKKLNEPSKENIKLSPLSKAKSVSDKKLKGLKSFLRGGRSKSSKNKSQSSDTIQASTSESNPDKIDINKATTAKEEIKVITPVPDEGAQVVVDYYSSIVQELGHSRYKTPLYLDTAELKKQSERALLEEGNFKRSSEIDADEDILLLQHTSKPRLSIVERMQTQHVRPEKSSHCIDSKIVIAKPNEPETPPEHKISSPDFESFSSKPQTPPPSPVAQPTVKKKVIKTKKIIKRTARSKSRDNSNTKSGTSVAAGIPSIVIHPSDMDRLQALHDQANNSKTKDEISLLKQYNESKEETEEDNSPKDMIKYDPEEFDVEAQEHVHSAINYLTDFGLFVFACWVYLFKDAYMVLPILALMVYRRIGEAISRNLPNFLKRKPS